jgi:uncharacterized protein
MAVQVTYPGVYVQEVPSGVRTIVGVATSIGCFVGRAKSGQLWTPTRVQNLTDFVRIFGDDPTFGDLSRYVRLFFLNGGTDCYVTRIANGALASAITLQNESKVAVLTLTALSAGSLGDTTRVSVDYNTPTPDKTFNLQLFQSTTDSRGQRVQANAETWANLSMDPASPFYAVSVLTQKSALVNAVDVGLVVPGPQNGYSLSSAPIAFDGSAADFRAKFAAAIGGLSPNRSFQISVDGNVTVPVTIADRFDNVVTFPGPLVTDLITQYQTAIAQDIDTALTAFGVLGVTVDVFIDRNPGAAALQMVVLRIQSKAQGDITILPGAANDATAALGFGAALGGAEVGAHAARRPAPTGVSYQAYDQPLLGSATAFLNLPQNGAAAIASVTLDGLDASGALQAVNVPLALGDTPPPAAGTPNWSGTPLLTKLQRWRDAVNAFQSANAATFRWTAQLWGNRIVFIPTSGADNAVPPFASAGTNLAANSIVNVRYDSLGVTGTPLYQTAGGGGSDGNPPHPADYDAAYVAIDHQVDLFNLMVLPPEHSPGATAVEKLYPNASIFCQGRRAFLVMDPPDAWTSVQTATSNVGTFRIGTVKDFSAVYLPRLTINEGGLNVTVGPAGAAAGIYARTDANRGVWKAPAGTEADFRGVTGVDLNLTDGESGQLNPLGINGIRVMPEGVLSWGARTNDGADMFASEYKYIPIRRLALFIEESLYRGLKWVVFEPNDTPLWAQIRLNVSSFMHGLFRQGAFQGTTPQDAYFVKVDAETTTQNDRDLGIVNIWVGFAPLKPAEFVVLYIQQIAGVLQT